MPVRRGIGLRTEVLSRSEALFRISMVSWAVEEGTESRRAMRALMATTGLVRSGLSARSWW